jgi:L-Ala-D/L-Glu epimerase
MKKIDLIFEPYKLKLLQPLITARGKTEFRRGFILKLVNETGVSGVGDVCPFPEFGSESFEDAEKYLNSLKYEFALDLEDIENSFDKNFADTAGLPAVRCGMEQALLSLITSEKGISINHLLNRKSLAEVKVNGVLGFKDPLSSAQAAEELVMEGFKTIKVKIGRDNFSEDLDCIERIYSAIPDSLRLRLDVNGKWSLKEAQQNISRLEKYKIEYIEQPVNTKEDLCELANSTNIPLAADESVRNSEDAQYFINNRSVKFLVLKPMMIGGIIPLMNIYDKAKRENLSVVVTSSFESAIGRAYAVFAASLIEEDIAHGLATENYFERKLLPQIYSVKNGVIHL